MDLVNLFMQGHIGSENLSRMLGDIRAVECMYLVQLL